MLAAAATAPSRADEDEDEPDIREVNRQGYRALLQAASPANGLVAKAARLLFNQLCREGQLDLQADIEWDEDAAAEDDDLLTKLIRAQDRVDSWLAAVQAEREAKIAQAIGAKQELPPEDAFAKTVADSAFRRLMHG